MKKDKYFKLDYGNKNRVISRLCNTGFKRVFSDSDKFFYNENKNLLITLSDMGDYILMVY